MALRMRSAVLRFENPLEAEKFLRVSRKRCLLSNHVVTVIKRYQPAFIKAQSPKGQAMINAPAAVRRAAPG